jgi:hypothetical protein
MLRRLTQILLPGATIVGRHLLAYCLLNIGEPVRALKEFKKCAKGIFGLMGEGHNEDWQLIVELTIEVEEKRRGQQLLPDNND